MAYDVSYVNELVSKYERLEGIAVTDAFKERAWLLKLLAEHTKLVGEIATTGLSELQETIMADFCQHFRANTGLTPIKVEESASVLIAPKRVYHFGGVRHG